MGLTPKSWDMKVKSITKTEKDKETGTEIIYKLIAKDKDGLNEVVITSAIPFQGISVKTGVIQIKLENSQLTIDDFKKEE